MKKAKKLPIRTRLNNQLGKMILIAGLIMTELSTGQAGTTLNGTGTNDPITVLKEGFCGAAGVNSYLMNGVLLFISLLVGLIVYGWSMRFGSRDAAVALKAAVIGTLIVGGSTTLAKTFISNGCV